MEAKQYTISEAAKKLHVGSHVLRFWEEELHLNIPRNEMGHRVYSEKEMKQLEQIINMKKDGFSLKDIEQTLTKINRPGNSLPGFRVGNFPKWQNDTV